MSPSINQITQNFINGQFIEMKSFEELNVINPATEEVISKIQTASEKELELAVISALEAQKKWKKTPLAERAKILNKAAQLMRERNDEIALIETFNTGKPVSESKTVDISSGAEALEYYASSIATLKGDYYKLGENFSYVWREPIGVVAGIGAWNYPFQIACWKSAPAIAAGNAMIYKPSELTPLSTNILAEIYKEAGLPDGVFNVIQGDERIGKEIVAHPKIKKISLTGEVETGKKIMASAANNLKQVTLELGGKSPLIIFEDANLDNAVTASMLANFYTQGEICSNATRVFVHKSIKDKFIEKLLKKTKNLKVSDPTKDHTDIGPLINETHFKKVMDYIEVGKSENAKLICGGDNPKGNKKGYFVNPTIFDECSDNMKIVKEEIFGPVMSILSFENEDEVITRANNTEFGLAAGVFTNNLQKAHRVSEALECGICWINTYNITPLEIPFGGVKMSGLGRENSRSGLLSYTQEKTVYVEMNDLESPYS